jgi:dipeptidyl aminopeptidase/acylaminoacyl peptidase
MRFPASLPIAFALVCAPSLPAAHAALPPLIPRSVLFGEAERHRPALAPDGRTLAFLKRGPAGTSDVWVQTIGRGDARQVTRIATGVQAYLWAGDGRHLLIPMEHEGDENWHLWAVEIATGAMRDLTPFPGARAEAPMVDPDHPDEVLVSLNVRDPKVGDLYRVRVSTGEATLDTQNPGDVVAWVPDRDFVVRAAVAMDPVTANTVLRVRDSGTAPWRDLVTWEFLAAGSDRSQRVLGFTADGRGLVVLTNEGTDTGRFAVLDAATGREISTLRAHPTADPWEVYDPILPYAPAVVLLHPDSGTVQAWAVNDLRPEWQVADPAVRADFDGLGRLQRGDVRIEDRSRDDRLWLVNIAPDDGPVTFWLWDRDRRRGTRLFTTRPELARWRFARQEGLRIRARDGLQIPCYLTTPPGVPAKRLPLVLMVHGGPWFRDEWGFDPMVQVLANRGYAVLQVNFRGSTGFGKAFLNASNGQMGRGGMQHDLTDAAAWAVREGLADPERVAILGGSYGGYATLAGLAFTPELYACGVDIVGPSNLESLIESFPPYWAPRRARWLRRIGDVVTDDSLNRAISPLFHADAIRAPLLIAHGANDPRVKLAESEQMVSALRGRGREVAFVVYPDEGHGIGRTENGLDLVGRIEEFLARNLGGRAEPWAPVPGCRAEVR